MKLFSTLFDTNRHRLLPLAAALAFLLGACGRSAPAASVDPHAGMIEVFNGAGYGWVTPKADVPVSALSAADFAAEDGVVRYQGAAYRAVQGVDVSYFQEEIDWNAVAASGVEFAMIRAGYRGYTDGAVSEDERFRENAANARAAGLEIGLYFFSQAVTPEEAAEEAAWLVSAAEPFDVTLPLAFDWEPIAGAGEGTRTAEMNGAETTACAVAFCAAVRAAGYEPCVYFSRWQGYYDYDLSQLTDAAFWVSGTGDWDDFYYAHAIWQYSFSGAVDGIAGSVDRDLRFIPIAQ